MIATVNLVRTVGLQLTTKGAFIHLLSCDTLIIFVPRDSIYSFQEAVSKLSMLPCLDVYVWPLSCCCLYPEPPKHDLIYALFSFLVLSPYSTIHS